MTMIMVVDGVMEAGEMLRVAGEEVGLVV